MEYSEELPVKANVTKQGQTEVTYFSIEGAGNIITELTALVDRYQTAIDDLILLRKEMIEKYN